MIVSILTNVFTLFSMCKFANRFLHLFHLHSKYQAYNIYILAIGLWKMAKYNISSLMCVIMIVIVISVVKILLMILIVSVIVIIIVFILILSWFRASSSVITHWFIRLQCILFICIPHKLSFTSKNVYSFIIMFFDFTFYWRGY